MTEQRYSSIPPDEPPVSNAPRSVRHVLAIGGGRGGVGNSILAVNLSVYLAQLGKRVVLVDADGSGGELHTALGVRLSGRPLDAEDRDDGGLSLVNTPIPGLMLLPQLYTVGSTVPLRPGRKPQWARKLRHLDVDYVILDLGPGTAPTSLDLFLSADIGVCVSAPEPPSVEATYRFVRALFQRRIRRSLVKDRFKMRVVERVQLELEALPSPQDLVRALARYDTTVAELAAQELARIRPRLVINHARLRGDTELGPAMCDMAKKYLGISYDYVGHVEQDDSVWLSIVRRRPLLIDSPTSKSARNIERIARRILAVAHARDIEREPEPVALLPEEPTLYDVLFTHRSASDEDLRRAYRRQRDIYQPDSLPLTSLLSEEKLTREQARIDEAHDTLLDPVKRKAYDKSMFPDTEQEQPKNRMLDAALDAERLMLREELTRELTAETEFSGSILKKVREAQGVELSDIAAHTKISGAHLASIENEEFEQLPALVYVRGFVQQIAKYLKLDPTQVSRTYLRRLRLWRHNRDAQA